ncbi:MAG: o-succinylbenzoate synthase, partial [Longimicrobiales bacterium]
MLTIQAITLREIRLPLREPFRISSGVVSERRIPLVELRDCDGVTAWGECVAGESPNYSPETIDTAWLALRQWVAPRILGVPLNGPRSAHEVLGRDFRGHEMAKGAVEMAVWALAAEREGVSLSRLLGGVKERIPVGVSLGIQPTPEALVERAAVAQREGYRKIKLKIEPGSDIEFV